jgi:hypothetical protein
MDISLSVSAAGTFRRITLSVQENSKQADCELSAIITSPSGKEEIFLPSPDKIASAVTYSHSGGRFVTHTGPGKYQIIFQPGESGPHRLKLIGKASGKAFEKEIQITF